MRSLTFDAKSAANIASLFWRAFPVMIARCKIRLDITDPSSIPVRWGKVLRLDINRAGKIHTVTGYCRKIYIEHLHHLETEWNDILIESRMSRAVIECLLYTTSWCCHEAQKSESETDSNLHGGTDLKKVWWWNSSSMTRWNLLCAVRYQHAFPASRLGSVCNLIMKVRVGAIITTLFACERSYIKVDLTLCSRFCMLFMINAMENHM